MSTSDSPTGGDAAVIDIGSNSVRLVIYRLEGRAIWTVYNEKVLAGLGREVAQTGRLAPEGVDAALNAIRRFRAVLGACRPNSVAVVATAAVREATDGPDFVDKVWRATGLKVRVLSGEEEAKFSGLGVLAGTPDAQGLAGDLGGSSLELIPLADGQPARGITLPLGPFALREGESFDLDRTRTRVRKILDKADGRFQAETLYAVGGGWRNFALLQMQIAGYPLQILHQYEMSAADALDAARLLARQSRGSLERAPGVSRRRLDAIPYAALVLEGLIERLNLRRVSISAYGVREGLLLDAMSPQVRALDPLVAGCATLGARSGAAIGDDLGATLDAWLKPLFSTLTPMFEHRDAVLTSAACHLADLGARLHPDHRDELVFEQVLRAPLSGVAHAERVFLAVTMFGRHSSSPNTPERETVARILSPERMARARALGSAMRLGCDLSGRCPELLAQSQLTVADGVIRLTANPGWADMLLGEQTAKRATTLAGQLGLGLKLGA